MGDSSFDWDDDDIRRERGKARELRKTEWWKRQTARCECHYCRGKFPAADLTMDHIVPLVRGGKSTKGNVVPCCKECNSRKQSLLPLEWAGYLDELARRTLA